MLNLYAVKVWHPSAPCYGETINIWTYTIDRAEYLAAESYPGCRAAAQPLADLAKLNPRPPGYFRRLYAHNEIERSDLAAGTDARLHG
jgi:hypothetical protein